MKRTLIVVAALVAFATAASGATISVASNKLTYNVGETITLTILGDSQGGKSNGIFGQLEYSSALTDTLTSNANALHTGSPGFDWVTGPLSRGDGFAWVMNEFSNASGGIVTVSNSLTATARLIAQAGGVVPVSWSTSPGLELQFFGLNTVNGTTNVSNPATSFTIVAVPEPTTAALLGLGVLGLVLGGRRRS